MIKGILFESQWSMKTKISIFAALCCILMLFACKDDSDVSASIVGKWSGNKADFKINPKGIIPAFTISEDNLAVQLEFKNDGTLILTDDQTTTSGTYQLNGRSLVININYTFEVIGLEGTYDVEELSRSKLRVSIEKEGNFEHPDTGQKIDGTVEATLFFDRQAN